MKRMGYKANPLWDAHITYSTVNLKHENSIFSEAPPPPHHPKETPCANAVGLWVSLSAAPTKCALNPSIEVLTAGLFLF